MAIYIKREVAAMIAGYVADEAEYKPGVNGMDDKPASKFDEGWEAACLRIKDILDDYEPSKTTERTEALVFPCFIGDTVYTTDGVNIYENTVQNITITPDHTIYDSTGPCFDERAIGVSVFLTREGAESKREGRYE